MASIVIAGTVRAMSPRPCTTIHCLQAMAAATMSTAALAASRPEYSAVHWDSPGADSAAAAIPDTTRTAAARPAMSTTGLTTGRIGCPGVEAARQDRLRRRTTNRISVPSHTPADPR